MSGSVRVDDVYGYRIAGLGIASVGMRPNQIAIKMPELGCSQVFTAQRRPGLGLRTKLDQVKAICGPVRCRDQKIARMASLWGHAGDEQVGSRHTRVRRGHRDETSPVPPTDPMPVDVVLVPIGTAVARRDHRAGRVHWDHGRRRLDRLLGRWMVTLMVLTNAVDVLRGLGGDDALPAEVVVGAAEASAFRRLIQPQPVGTRTPSRQSPPHRDRVAPLK
jgi:hypothetical protein